MNWTLEMLEDAADGFRQAGIGVIEMDLGSNSLVVGGLQGSARFAGVQVVVTPSLEYILKLETLYGAPRLPKQQAESLFQFAFQELLGPAMKQSNLVYDDQLQCFSRDLYRITEKVDELVTWTRQALEHPLQFTLDEEDLAVWRSEATSSHTHKADSHE